MFISYLKHIQRKNKITLEELLDQYKQNELLQSTYSIGTKNNYLSVIKMIKKDSIVKMKVSQINTTILQEYLNTLSNQKSFSKSRIIAYSALLTNVFDYAIYPLQIIITNPMQHIKLVQQTEQDIFSNLNQKQETITHDQYQKIVSYLQSRNNPHLLPIQIAYYTGLRIGEAVALTWDDINLDQQYLIVQRAMVLNCEGKNRLEFTTPKRNKTRIVYFPNALKEILIKEKQQNKPIVNYYIKQTENNLIHYPIYTGVMNHPNQIPINLVCTKQDGSFINRRSLATICSRLNKYIPELSNFHFHILRHTYASNLLQRNINSQQVKELLGHQDIRTTMNVYSHNDQKELLEKVKVLDEL